MADPQDQDIISCEERVHIENIVNEKLAEMGRLRDFFGSGHGVDVVTLIDSWIQREVIPHEKRLGIKLRYTLEVLEGNSRFTIVGVSRE
jgi:hypothetical protein